jgi:hypothetical protein
MFAFGENIQFLEKIFESKQRSNTLVKGIFVKNHATTNASF